MSPLLSERCRRWPLYSVTAHTPSQRWLLCISRRLVADLSPAEKATLFTNGASGVERIHWPKYNWWSEALHGVARDGVGTSFPQIGLVAASYNRSLWHAIADVTSTEGRGKNNGLKGGMYQGLTFWAPNVRSLVPLATVLSADSECRCS